MNRVLIIEDRGTGERERILESDGNFRESIAFAAHHRWNNMTIDDAISAMDRGAILQTAGFNRFFEGKPESVRDALNSLPRAAAFD